MNKVFAVAGAAALALAISLSASTPSSADAGSDAAAAAFAGGVFGFVAGAAIAGSSNEDNSYSVDYSSSDWEQHVQDCEDAYGWRYDAETDLITKHHRQFYCDL